MTLQDGVTFHEGQPFAADDVKFNVERVLNADTGSPLAAMLEPIDKTEIVDPLHLRFTLKRPWPAVVENFSNIKIYSKTASDESIRTKPNGTGPFKFVEWKQNDYIRLQKNTAYWMKGVPFLDQIDFKPVTEQETRISMMETLAADVLFSLELKDIPRIEANQQLSVQRSTSDDNGDILYINNSREPMSNQKLRLAISYAIDRETFVKQFLAGYGSKNTSPWDKNHWAFNSAANTDTFPYDLEKAKQLLVEAGYADGKDSSGNQITLNIIFPVGYPEWKQGSIMLESALKKLGVASKVEELELNVWADRLISTADFDLSWDFHGGHVTDPASTLALAFFYPPGPKNLCRYKDDQLGKLIEQGGSAFEQSERKKIYGDFQQRWNEVQPGYIVGQRVMAHATQTFIKGFVTHPLFFQDFRTVYRDQ
jgi:glutathione transport system substrate-binding protein